jgi:hypothetical protein
LERFPKFIKLNAEAIGGGEATGGTANGSGIDVCTYGTAGDDG